MSSRELSRYIAAIGRALGDHVAGAARAPGCDLRLEVQLDARRRPAVSLGVRPSPVPAAIDGVLTRVEALAAPVVRGPVGLRLVFAVHGGSGDDLG